MDENQVDGWVKERMYNDIMKTLINNIINMSLLDKELSMNKIDINMSLSPKELRKMMIQMFHINNFICNMYRKRKHILNDTTWLREEKF